MSQTARKQSFERLSEHYKAESHFSNEGQPDRFALVLAPADKRDVHRVISTHPTFGEACGIAADAILGGDIPLDGIFDLDSNTMIELHISTPIVSRSEDQGICVNPLESEDESSYVPTSNGEKVALLSPADLDTFVGKKVRRGDGVEFVVTEINEKDGMPTVGGGNYWGYALDVTIVSD